jgi:hypothetical protein
LVDLSPDVYYFLLSASLVLGLCKTPDASLCCLFEICLLFINLGTHSHSLCYVPQVVESCVFISLHPRNFLNFSLIYSVGSPAHTQFCWISPFGGGSEGGSEAQLTVAMAVILTNSAACSASS